MPKTNASETATGGWRERLRNSPIGNVAVVAITTLVIIVGAWAVGHFGGGADKPSQVASVDQSGVSQIEGTGKGNPPAIGETAPAFETLTITGKPVSLAEFEGKPVWLVFGATWCTNCRAEAPDIETLHKKYGDKVAIIAVYVREGIKDVSDYAKRAGLGFTQVADSDTEVSSRYRVMGLPTHYFIGADGKIKSIEVGAITPETASKHLEELLAS